MRLFFPLTIAALSTVFMANAAQADTYQAGEFTVTISEGDGSGQVYTGCDRQNRCIRLEGGMNWRDGGWRGIGWDNGDYIYSVSWEEEKQGPMYLTVLRNNKRILRRVMTPLEN